MSSGRAVPACYGNQVEYCNIMAQSTSTSIINQGKNFDPMKA